MKIVKIILLFLTLNNSFNNLIFSKIDSALFTKISKLAVIAATPAILGYYAKKIAQKNEHLNRFFISLSAGTSLAEFDQLTKFDLDLLNMLKSTLFYTANLFTIDSIRKLFVDEESSDRKIKKNNKRFFSADFSNLFQHFGIINETFAGEFTKYLHLFRINNFALEFLKKKFV